MSLSDEKDGWKPGVAGFCGGVVSTLLLLPLDNIKVRLQVNEGTTTTSMSTATTSAATLSSKLPSMTNAGIACDKSAPRLGAIRMLQGVIKYEGITGLYAGMVPAMIGSAISWGGFFFIYENIKRQLIHYKFANSFDGTNDIKVSLNSMDNFIVGTASSIVMV